MLKVIFTLDYEIHGNGDGRPHELMVEPTSRMMDQFEEYGAKLTIMADVAEILKFREYRDQTGKDTYHYEAIANQLRDAIRRGHDVQLHLHASYFNARHTSRGWEQDWSEYNFAGLPYERMNEIVRRGKEYLEELLRPVDPAYRCHVFRAANWAVQPSGNVVRALVANGIDIDTSVFKYGKRNGIVSFDYSHAVSELLPWPAAAHDVCQRDNDSRLWEYPIYCERRWIGAFLTPQRVRRSLVSRAHKISSDPNFAARLSGVPGVKNGDSNRLSRLVGKHAWKADFNQCTGAQLSRALRRAQRIHAAEMKDVPFVLIGHSKLFTGQNQSSLRPFLKDVSRGCIEAEFGLFRDCCSHLPEAVAQSQGVESEACGV